MTSHHSIGKILGFQLPLLIMYILLILAGDRAFRDEDGYFYFVGRSDDVILSAGLVAKTSD